MQVLSFEELDVDAKADDAKRAEYNDVDSVRKGMQHGSPQREIGALGQAVAQTPHGGGLSYLAAVNAGYQRPF